MQHRQTLKSFALLHDSMNSEFSPIIKSFRTRATRNAEISCNVQKVRKQKHPVSQDMYLDAILHLGSKNSSGDSVLYSSWKKPKSCTCLPALLATWLKTSGIIPARCLTVIALSSLPENVLFLFG